MKDEIRIFVYSGSCNVHSTTQIIAKELVKTIAEVVQTRIVVNEYVGHYTNIEECIGCTQCFIHGNCVLDAKDDMREIRERMLEADCIIMGSPVYFHAVSGNMKKLMDRLSYWTHTMELTGKLGIVIATSGGNGLNYVSEYLNKFMDYLGIVNVGIIEAATYNESYMKENQVLESIRPKLLECAHGVKQYVLEGHIPYPSELQKKVFRMNNQKYMKLEAYQDDIAEVRKWYDHDYTSYKDYDAVIENLYKNKAECL